jgi:hypothetical protein
MNREWARCFLAGGWQGATKENIPCGSSTEKQRSQAPAKKQPSGLPIFAAAAALLVGRRSMKDILVPVRKDCPCGSTCTLQLRQISGNAPVSCL